MSASTYRFDAPWQHTGVRCSECSVNPIEGYRYKHLKNNYNLCGKCFKKEVPEEDVKLFFKIARRDGYPPYQIRLIECDACGDAPIAPRYKREQEADSEGEPRTSRWVNLCISCFQEQDEEVQAQYVQTLKSLSHPSRFQKYHISCKYNFTCGLCKIHPVHLPAYGKQMANGSGLEEVYCFGCYDDLKRNEGLDESQWKELSNDPYHFTQLSCHECGSNPIKGTAFRHPSKPEEIICLTCHCWHMEDDPELAKAYTVIDAPLTLRGALRLATAEASASADEGASDLLQQLRSVHEQQLSFQLETMKLQNLVALSAASASMMGRW